MQDYVKAIEHYELIIYRFPKWEGVDEIYPNLAKAYRNKGQLAMERQTYRRMVEHYPCQVTHAYGISLPSFIRAIFRRT